MTGENYLYGDIRALNITLDGNTVLMNDVALLAGDDTTDRGNVVIGNEDGSNYTIGSHDLTVVANDVNVNGLVEINSLNVNAEGNFEYNGSTMTLLKDLDEYARMDPPKPWNG